MVRSIAGWVLGALLIAAGIAYLGDSLYIRHKVASANSAALGNVRFYYATKLKNGKLNIYQDSPQNEVCVHALFPHYGYKPCWFASRNTVRVVAGAARIAVIDFFPEKILPVPAPVRAKHPRSSLDRGEASHLVPDIRIDLFSNLA